MPAGRPLEWTFEKAMALANSLIDWLNADKEENIFFQEYLLDNRIRPQIISELTSKFPEFAEVIKEAKQIQEYRINKLAMRNKINPIMAIFTLKNHHGYADKQEIKSDNLNRNIDAKDLLGSDEDLKEMLRTLSEDKA